jgi:predicted Rossmann fold flavoprotein
VQKLSGRSVPDAKISFYVHGKKKFSKIGNILFTHFGISGPTILNSAGQVADLLEEGAVTAVIDLYPAMDLGILDRHITKVFDENKNKILKNIFKEIVPVGTGEVLLSLLPTIDPEVKVHSVLKGERRAIAKLLKELPLTIEGLMGFERAVVADGGLSLTEIDLRTMRSKKFENLFVTGDLLHITRPSGGYSLQLCWTTGYVAGNNA